MQHVILENEGLVARINPLGAELVSLYNTLTDTEYMWNGDANFWGKHSPVLFPIVGGLKNNYYEYRGESYSLGRHGFARDKLFETEVNSKSKAIFSLRATTETKKVFPFDFILKLHYSLSPSELLVTYQVANPAQENLYFSIGGHPAFSLQTDNNIRYEDCYLEFELPETVSLLLSSEGLMNGKELPFLNNEKTIPLKKELFYNDALVLKGPKSGAISLLNNKIPGGLKFKYNDFPYLAIWSAKNAPFLCIEPWYGIADSMLHDNSLINKTGIACLEAHGNWEKTWSVLIL
jgi:galactose mutarotase-like enzyme